MIVKGYFPKSVIFKMINYRWEKLDQTLLGTKGKPVYKDTIFSKKGYGAVAILYLAPKAVVKKHMHIDDREIYLVWDLRQKFRFEICGCGQSHGLKNISEKNWAIVLSIKYDSIA